LPAIFIDTCKHSPYKNSLSFYGARSEALHEHFLHTKIKDNDGQRSQHNICENKVPHGGVRADGIADTGRDRFPSPKAKNIHGIEEVVPYPHPQKDHRCRGTGLDQRKDDPEKSREWVGAVNVRRLIQTRGNRLNEADIEEYRGAEIRSGVKQKQAGHGIQ